MARIHRSRGKFGTIVRDLRRAKDLTQEELAKKARMERGHLGRIETGTTNPSIDTRKRLAKALQVEPMFLLMA